MKIKFKDSIPPLSKDEYSGLKQSLLKEGCRDSLLVWGDVLIDGHNRYEICTENKISYKTQPIEFNSDEEALDWIDKNQLSRRNLTPDQMSLIRGRIYNRQKKSHGGDRNSSVQNEHLKSSEKLAQQFGVSASTIRRDAESATMLENYPEQAAKIMKGELTKGQAIKEIRESLPKSDPIPIPNGKYEVIYCDPPWRYDAAISRLEVEGHYPTMDLEEICNLGSEVDKLAAKDCVLFMWTTTAKLNWFMTVLDAWKFEYKTSMIWDKVDYNMGYYCSPRHEILIIAGRGSSTPTVEDKKVIQSIDSVQSIPKSNKHSQKPEEYYDIIEKLYPGTKKIELFARNKRKGWESWGNQIDIPNEE